jgi:hypothetical protein
MRYFLLVYDRRAGRLVEDIRVFEDSHEAFSARMERDRRALREHQELEVVVLGAETEDDLRNTHSRYFGLNREPSLS